MNKTKPVLIFLMKLLVSTGLIVFFLTQIHIERFLGTLLSARGDFWLRRCGLSPFISPHSSSLPEMGDFLPPVRFRYSL
jgi:hypothetical protein